tara:strand:- start:895 stop:1464 length:570 start_codon:yes stop_codon:yes gene_type:complete
MAIMSQIEGIIKPAQQDYAGGLAPVDNPDKVFADILREDYNDYVENFREFEKRLLGKTDDTTLIDRSRVNAAKQRRIAAAIQKRNLERYGGAGLSQAQLQQQQRTAQRGGALSLANTVNNARVRQRAMNQALLQEMIGIGQGVNARALQGLGTAAQGEVQRRGAYKQAKANYASQMGNMAASILAAFQI